LAAGHGPFDEHPYSTCWKLTWIMPCHSLKLRVDMCRILSLALTCTLLIFLD
jgi:hypothetical protein